MNLLLVGGGVVGGLAAIIHGVLTQRRLVGAPGGIDDRTPASVRRLRAMLLQFSTFDWLTGGIALVWAGLALGREGQLVAGLLVGSAYLFGVIGNAWATRGRHPGWIVYAVAVALIGWGLAV